MFALFNPPKGAKYAKGRKASKSKGRKRKVGAYASFIRRYFASHPGTSLSAAAAAWSGGEGKIRKHRKARAKAHGRTPRKYVLRSALPGIVGSAMKSNICNVSSLQKARARYCGTGVKTGMGSFIDKFKSASAGLGDRRGRRGDDIARQQQITDERSSGQEFANGDCCVLNVLDAAAGDRGARSTARQHKCC